MCIAEGLCKTFVIRGNGADYEAGFSENAALPRLLIIRYSALLVETASNFILMAALPVLAILERVLINEHS